MDSTSNVTASPTPGFKDDPYCRNCGYNLTGCVDSSKCPECGRPLVEILVRDSFPGQRGQRFTSKQMIGGLPLIAIATGPQGREKIGRPVGIIAIGDVPRGIIAIGGFPLGVIAIGGFARGIIACGGFTCGVLAVGGCSIGLFALGGVAIGGYALGGLAAYVIRGFGGLPLRIWPF